MKFDTSFTITAIIAFIALLSPIVTAIINNHYLTKQKSLEYSELKTRSASQHKRELFEDFLTRSGKFIVLPSLKTTFEQDAIILNDLSASCALIVPYLDEHDRKTIKTFSEKIPKINWDDASNSDVRNYFNDSVVPIIQKELQKL
ncbi:hypothetical protein [Leuconostoc sp.]|uniref:hypothetical protein n=1 Tax=Leuconostoc sp. TaxID=1930076 RepID=UPI00257F454D|nr:hypothetical protein [Leuconostoc sp.]NLT84884.1 hypothetical protein [Leuconostoc sp.]